MTCGLKILELVHERFYVAYDARKPDGEHKSPKKRSGKKHDAPVEYDVRVSFPCLECPRKLLTLRRLLFPEYEWIP